MSLNRSLATRLIAPIFIPLIPLQIGCHQDAKKTEQDKSVAVDDQKESDRKKSATIHEAFSQGTIKHIGSIYDRDLYPADTPALLEVLDFIDANTDLNEKQKEAIKKNIETNFKQGGYRTLTNYTDPQRLEQDITELLSLEKKLTTKGMDLGEDLWDFSAKRGLGLLALKLRYLNQAFNARQVEKLAAKLSLTDLSLLETSPGYGPLASLSSEEFDTVLNIDTNSPLEKYRQVELNYHILKSEAEGLLNAKQSKKLREIAESLRKSDSDSLPLDYFFGSLEFFSERNPDQSLAPQSIDALIKLLENNAQAMKNFAYRFDEINGFSFKQLNRVVNGNYPKLSGPSKDAMNAEIARIHFENLDMVINPEIDDFMLRETAKAHNNGLIDNREAELLLESSLQNSMNRDLISCINAELIPSQYISRFVDLRNEHKRFYYLLAHLALKIEERIENPFFKDANKFMQEEPHPIYGTREEICQRAWEKQVNPWKIAQYISKQYEAKSTNTEYDAGHRRESEQLQYEQRKAIWDSTKEFVTELNLGLEPVR